MTVQKGELSTLNNYLKIVIGTAFVGVLLVAGCGQAGEPEEELASDPAALLPQYVPEALVEEFDLSPVVQEPLLVEAFDLPPVVQEPLLEEELDLSSGGVEGIVGGTHLVMGTSGAVDPSDSTGALQQPEYECEL